MRRDLDLVRSILKTGADSNEPVDANTLADERHPLDPIVYHMADEANSAAQSQDVQEPHGEAQPTD